MLGIEPGTLRLQDKHSTNCTDSQSLEPLSAMFLQETVAEGPQQVPAVAGRRPWAPTGDPLVGLQEARLASQEGHFTIKKIKCFANVLNH